MQIENEEGKEDGKKGHEEEKQVAQQNRETVTGKKWNLNFIFGLHTLPLNLVEAHADRSYRNDANYVCGGLTQG